jgi:hypothetical protein
MSSKNEAEARLILAFKIGFSIMGVALIALGLWQGFFLGVVGMIDGFTSSPVSGAAVAWGALRCFVVTGICNALGGAIIASAYMTK